MHELSFNVRNQGLARTDGVVVVADSVNYLRAKFTFSSEWDGLTKTAVFRRSDAVYNVLLTDDACIVPHEVIAAPACYVSVFGVDGDVLRITANPVRVAVVESGYAEGETPPEPTPDVYQQIIGIMEQQTADAEAAQAAERGAQEAQAEAERHMSSAEEYAADAQRSAEDALQSEINAKTSEDNAKESETSALEAMQTAVEAMADLDNKLDKTNNANVVYATDETGNQVALPITGGNNIEYVVGQTITGSVLINTLESTGVEADQVLTDLLAPKYESNITLDESTTIRHNHTPVHNHTLVNKQYVDTAIQDQIGDIEGSFTEEERNKLAGIEVGANKYEHPATHPASMITGLPTSLPANGGNADTVNGKTVGVDVPPDAKFTDTVYIHPATHPPSIIAQDATNRFVTDTEKSTWNNKADKSYVDGLVGDIESALDAILGV